MAFGGFPGFGLMQGASFGGPVGLARARDPRYAYAQALLKEGVDTSPVQSPWQGVARMGAAALGAMTYGAADKEYRGREQAYQKAIADALKAGQGTPAVTRTTEDQSTYGGEGPMTQIVTPGVAGDRQRMFNILAANPDAASMALPLQMQDMNYQRERADRKEDIAGQQGFTREMAQAQNTFAASQSELTRAQQAALQSNSLENQAALQRAQQAFTASQNELNRALEGQKINAAAGSAGFARADKLRDEYSALTKDFRTVQDAYSKIQSTSDTGAGDMSLLYSYVKLLDPGSVVRESEFATAAASGSFGEQVQGAVQRVLTGERLPDTLRAAFKNEAGNLYKAQKAGAERLQAQYTDLAKRYNVNPTDVIQNYAAPEPAPDPNAPVKVTSPDDMAKLAPGTRFVAPDGSIRIKP